MDRSAVTASSDAPKRVFSKKARKRARILRTRSFSLKSSACVTPPARKARLCGHFPATIPMISRSPARAGRASRAPVPTVALKRGSTASNQGRPA